MVLEKCHRPYIKKTFFSVIMSYRKGASDEGLSFEDANLVYVSDRHGVLTSPPGYEKSAKKFVRECDVVHGNLR